MSGLALHPFLDADRSSTASSIPVSHEKSAQALVGLGDGGISIGGALNCSIPTMRLGKILMESGVPADPAIAMEINGETRPNTILGMIPRVL